MGTTTIAAVATALGGGLAIWLWYLKRKTAGPSKQEKVSSYDNELDAVQKQIAAARLRGDDATADALMRRVREITARTAALNSPGAAGERGDDDAASGNTDKAADR